MKLFSTIKKVFNENGDLHFKRITIIETKWFNIYIHCFYNSDNSIYLHNHPWSFVSFVLIGCLYEVGINKIKKYRIGSFIFNKKDQFHQIKIIKPVISLAITGPTRYYWRYWLKGNKI